MNSKTQNALINEAFKTRHPFRFPDIFLTGMITERLNFVCETLPFIYHQGTVDRCIDLIKMANKAESSSSTPVIICSTGRHIGHQSFSDYYKIWTALKNSYGDKLKSSNN